MKVKEVDALGTAELSNTNAAYVGALDGNIQDLLDQPRLIAKLWLRSIMLTVERQKYLVT